MAMAEAISQGIFIFLFIVQISLAQQCLNNGYKNSAAVPQQSFQQTSCGSKQIAQNGLNFNSPQQGSMQQMNYQQQSNIQQAPLAQPARNQPQMNLQQGASQQQVNSMSNSQLLKQPNQDLTANIFSALYNIQQSSQNQRDTRNIVKENPQQMSRYELLPTAPNQPNPTLISSTPMNKPQNNQPSLSNSYSEQPSQPSFTFKFVPVSDVPVQQNQQTFTLPVHKVNDPSQSYSIQSQPVPNSVTRQQSTTIQSPMVMIPGTQSTSQNQPIVLSFQSPQTSPVQNPATLSSTQTTYSQPMVYTMQTQPSSGFNQNQQILQVPSQNPTVNSSPMDKQSLISYVMSQMQNPQGSGNILSSILPSTLNTKSEKSSSMKALLPLIFNLLNEKKSCCGCPQCGCNNSNNNEEPKPEPIINTGYSNHINYSQQQPAETLAKITEFVDKSIDSTDKHVKKEKPNTVNATNNTAESSEEAEEANESDEEEED